MQLGRAAAITLALALASVVAANAQQTVSGRTAGGRDSDVCLCGTAVGGSGRCFVDKACESAPDCSSDTDCAPGSFCIADTDCCLVPKCVASCAGRSCTVAPVHGICQSYDPCPATAVPAATTGSSIVLAIVLLIAAVSRLLVRRSTPR